MKPRTFLALLISAALTAVAVWQISKGPDAIDDVDQSRAIATPTGDTIVVTVRNGDSPQDIGERLQAMGVVDSATQFRVLVSFLGYDGILQAGDYEFPRRTPTLDAVYRLRQGLVSTRSVTVVEGWRLEEVADALAKEGIDRDEFLVEAHSQFYGPSGVERQSSSSGLEGFLLPATYPILKGDTAASVIERMVKAFEGEALPEIKASAAANTLDYREVVTLASIIEREAQVPSERPVMAQVFLSRMAQGIPLEADPTVQYAIAQDPRSVKAYGYWKSALTSADLQIDSPYNTYQNRGLPPGPICNPGLESIRAVLNPTKTKFLYFVAKPDGSHLFAETFQEHLDNIKKAQGQ